MALKRATYTSPPRAGTRPRRVGGRGGPFVRKRWARARVERPLVQILVAVATIQMRTLKTEVEKGSMGTALGHGLVGPKR